MEWLGRMSGDVTGSGGVLGDIFENEEDEGYVSNDPSTSGYA